MRRHGSHPHRHPHRPLRPREGVDDVHVGPVRAGLGAQVEHQDPLLDLGRHPRRRALDGPPQRPTATVDDGDALRGELLVGVDLAEVQVRLRDVEHRSHEGGIEQVRLGVGRWLVGGDGGAQRHRHVTVALEPLLGHLLSLFAEAAVDVVVDLAQRDDAVAVVVRRSGQEALHEVVGEQAGVVAGVGVVGQLARSAARDDEPAPPRQRRADVAAALEASAVTAVEHHDGAGRGRVVHHPAEVRCLHGRRPEAVDAAVAGAEVELAALVEHAVTAVVEQHGVLA